MLLIDLTLDDGHTKAPRRPRLYLPACVAHIFTSLTFRFAFLIVLPLFLSSSRKSGAFITSPTARPSSTHFSTRNAKTKTKLSHFAMLSLRKTLPRVLRSQARRSRVNLAPAAAHFSSSSRYAASSEGNDARFQEKDQIKAEKQAKDPEKMANLVEEQNKQRDDPHRTSKDFTTPGVKGKATSDQPIGRNVNNKASG
jgi:hypothetical protein